MKALLLLIAAQGAIDVVTPFVMSNGDHIFYLVTQPDSYGVKLDQVARQQLIDNAIAKSLGEARWCLDGWEITEQSENKGFVAVRGKCL